MKFYREYPSCTYELILLTSVNSCPPILLVQKSLIFVRIREAHFVSIYCSPNLFKRLYYENFLQVNTHIGNMVYSEIQRQTTIEGVAQSVVDQICRLHKEQFVKSENQKCLRREDMTLLIRLFNINIGEEKLMNK